MQMIQIIGDEYSWMFYPFANCLVLGRVYVYVCVYVRMKVSEYGFKWCHGKCADEYSGLWLPFGDRRIWILNSKGSQEANGQSRRSSRRRAALVRESSFACFWWQNGASAFPVCGNVCGGNIASSKANTLSVIRLPVGLFDVDGWRQNGEKSGKS